MPYCNSSHRLPACALQRWRVQDAARCWTDHEHGAISSATKRPCRTFVLSREFHGTMLSYCQPRQSPVRVSWYGRRYTIFSSLKVSRFLAKIGHAQWFVLAPAVGCSL